MTRTAHLPDPIETASIQEIRDLQLSRLKRTVAHCYQHSGFHKHRFQSAGVTPDDIQSLDDLRKIPFTTKDDLRATYPFGMLCVPSNQLARIHASSGSTGKPTVVGYTREDIDTWAGLVARSIFAAGGRPGDMVHVAYGYGLFTGGLGAHYGAERLGCTVVPVSGGQTEKQIQLIQDFEPDIIMATPSYMLTLRDEIFRQNISPGSLSLRIGIFGAEPWSDSMRVELESSLGIDAVDIYGLSEIMGPGVAQECVEAKDGATLWEDHFYPEIVDPETGQIVPDGVEGELVLTTLTKQAMPMLRYRTGDRTRLLPGSSRSMRRLQRITGRTDDMLIIRGVNVFPSQIEEHVMAVPGLSPHYRIEISRPAHLDTVRITVEPDIQSDSSHDVLASTLRTRIKSMVGISADIQVVSPGSIPRSEGKAKRVIDHRHG